MVLGLIVSCDRHEEKIFPQVTPITESVYSSVTVQPDSLYKAFAVVNGIVDENLVEEGEMVKKGDPVVQIINSNPKIKRGKCANRAGAGPAKPSGRCYRARGNSRRSSRQQD